MAVFGNIEDIKSQVTSEKFAKAFKYLDKVFTKGSTENKRLLSLPLDAFERVEIDENNFGLEQVYLSKRRDTCFFESHQQYIDVQCILEGEELIEVRNIKYLYTTMHYNQEMDLIKYKSTNKSSIIRLTKGDIAIFYPEDGHMPCVRSNTSIKVVKTVVKVKV
jgi:YhcH/YjgK/YiaL family protein